MPRDEDKAKRLRLWRPRFSVRTLAIVVTLVCAYLGSWEYTKRWGVIVVQGNIEASSRFIASISSPMPFIVVATEIDQAKSLDHATLALDEIELIPPLTPGYPKTINGMLELNRHSYLCIFRWVYRLDLLSARIDADMIALSYQSPPHGIKVLKSTQDWGGKGP